MSLTSSSYEQGQSFSRKTKDIPAPLLDVLFGDDGRVSVTDEICDQLLRKGVQQQIGEISDSVLIYVLNLCPNQSITDLRKLKCRWAPAFDPMTTPK